MPIKASPQPQSGYRLLTGEEEETEKKKCRRNLRDGPQLPSIVASSIDSLLRPRSARLPSEGVGGFPVIKVTP